MPPPQRCWSPSWPSSWPGTQGRAPGTLCTNEATTSTFTAATSLWPQAEAPILLLDCYIYTLFMIHSIITSGFRLSNCFQMILKHDSWCSVKFKTCFQAITFEKFLRFSNIFLIECGPDSRHDNPQQSSPSTTTTPGRRTGHEAWRFPSIYTVPMGGTK
jgi:hypothetical protein